MMDDRSTDEVCVVVPVYNEATVITEVLRALIAVFPHVVCVDDGSSDDSAALAESEGAVVLRHPLNLGAGAATQTGIEYAVRDPRFSHVITFDADGQHQVDDALAMWHAACSQGLDVVFGTRFHGTTTGMPTSRRLLLKLATWGTRLTTGLALTDTHVGLRVFSRSAAAGLKLRLPGMAHASEIVHHVARARLSYGEVPVHVAYTPYSLAKGQRNMNALNIVVDVFVSRLYALT